MRGGGLTPRRAGIGAVHVIVFKLHACMMRERFFSSRSRGDRTAALPSDDPKTIFTNNNAPSRNGLFAISRGHDASRGPAPSAARHRSATAGSRPSSPPSAARDLEPSSVRTPTRERPRSKNRPFPFVSLPWVGGFSPRHVHGLRRLVRLPRGACGDARRRGAPRGARGGDPGRDRRLRPPPGFQPRRRRPRDRSTPSSS